jgi:hypothetical protein
LKASPDHPNRLSRRALRTDDTEADWVEAASVDPCEAKRVLTRVPEGDRERLTVRRDQAGAVKQGVPSDEPPAAGMT